MGQLYSGQKSDIYIKIYKIPVYIYIKICRHPQTMPPDSKCFTKIALTLRQGGSSRTWVNWQTDIWPASGCRTVCTALSFIGLSFKPNLWIYTLVSFSPTHARCGTVVGERKPKPNGPWAAVGPCRSWLLSDGCPGRKACKSGYTGVVHHIAHHCTASHIVDWQRDRQQTQAPIS